MPVCYHSPESTDSAKLPEMMALGTAGRVRRSKTLSWSHGENTTPTAANAGSLPQTLPCRAEGLFAVETLNQYTGTKDSSNANRSSIQTWNPGSISLASKTPSVTHSPMKRAVSEVIFIYNVFVPCLFGKWRTSWSRWHLSELPFHTLCIQTPKVWASQGSYWGEHIHLHQKYITCLLWK